MKLDAEPLGPYEPFVNEAVRIGKKNSFMVARDRPISLDRWLLVPSEAER
jgi:hypothetical protein